MTTSKRIAVKIGTYTKDGQQKNRYKNIGEIITKDDGGQFVKIDATCLSMQLFALANKERNDFVLCSLFSDDDKKPASGSNEPPPSDYEDAPF
jgi:hypothetical protein